MQKSLKRYFPLFVLPTLLAFVIAFLIPFIMGVYLSFCKFTTVTNAQWVGFSNYVRAFTANKEFVNALWFTVKFTVVSVISINVLAFMAACMSIGVVGMELGFTPFIKETALPLLTSLSPSIVFIIILVLCALANFVLSASAMFAALSAPFTQIALSLNLQPVTAMMCIVLGADMYFLPHEITTLVVIFSFGMMTMRDFIMLASIKSAVTFASFLVLQLPYWYLMGWIFN